MSKQWHYARGGRQEGPAPTEELISLLAAGRLMPGDLVWCEGMPDWLPASSIPELFQPAMAAAEHAPIPLGDTAVPASPTNLNYFNPAQPGQARAYAGFWLRFIAYIIDAILMWIVTLPVQFLIGLAVAHPVRFAPGRGPWGMIPFSFSGGLYGMLIQWLYFALMESSVHRATVGKMALGIEVTDVYGHQVTFGRATGRYFAKILSGLIFYVGFIMAAFTQQKQGLHDLLASTLVVRKTLPQHSA